MMDPAELTALLYPVAGAVLTVTTPRRMQTQAPAGRTFWARCYLAHACDPRGPSHDLAWETAFEKLHPLRRDPEPAWRRLRRADAVEVEVLASLVGVLPGEVAELIAAIVAWLL